jgi:Uma2 family endonuclease
VTVTTGSLAGRPAEEVSVEAFLVPNAYPTDAQLVDGVIVMNDATFRHQLIALRLATALHLWCEAAPGRGRAGFGGNWVVGDRSVAKPDAWWIRPDDQPGLVGARSDVPPTIAVEVRSPGTWRLDRGRKRELYDAVGVAELWLADGDTNELAVLTRRTLGAPLLRSGRLVGGGTLTTPLLAGFALDVTGVFAD